MARLGRWVAGILLLGGCGGGDAANPDVAVQVDSVVLDERVGSPVVVLLEREGERSLPIWIGLAEAQSIAAEMEKVRPERPNTHDLATRLIQGLQGEVERVVVTELRGGTYYATIFLRAHGRSIEVDSRPSDAIAIALRTGAPLFARDDLLSSDGERGGSNPGQRIRFVPPGRPGVAPATPGLGTAI
jgi:bifunctional DNase/RNase